MIKIEYPYKSSCKGCNYSDWCCIDRNTKMNHRKCYIDFLTVKMKKKPKEIIMLWNQCIQGTDLMLEHIKSWFSDDFFHEEPARPNWVAMTQTEKKASVADGLLFFHNNHISYLSIHQQQERDICNQFWSDDEFDKYVDLAVAFLDTVFGSWRNEPYIRCMRCGNVIENNSQHNRKHCDNCKGFQKLKYLKEKTCVDCGERLEISSNMNNRQIRCGCCQQKVDKEHARIRAKNYRDRKKSRYQLKE